jgi:hypothetical protein
MKYTLSLIAALFLLAACEREELPVAPHETGLLTTSAVNMDANYRWQVYFDLGTNREVGRCLKTSWDLAFQTTASGFHVFLNSSKAMAAWNTGDTNFTAVTDSTGFAAGRKFDEASGNEDSTAIGDWRQTKPVYIIDRGYSETGQPQGIRKMQILQVSSSAYEIRFATLNGTPNSITIPKDSIYNFSFVSLSSTGNIVSVEPPKANWDLVFTQYTHIFHQPFTPYLVTGCLLNPWQTVSAVDTVNTFESIGFSQLQQYTLGNAVNNIGYEWKVFDGTQFTIVPNRFYIIRDSENYFYKLRFTDFYDANGVKGNPKWEFQRL